jgi:hypothetical protein
MTVSNMTEQLPPYSTLPQPEPEPPQYTLPETFSIGRFSTRHLVRPNQLKAHLQLLAAFNHLKQQVVASESIIAGLELDSEKRWVWFVNLAVDSDGTCLTTNILHAIVLVTYCIDGGQF